MFKIAFRNSWRNRSFSLINVAGLSLGIAVFLFIMQYVAYEWSANRFNENYDRLYRTNVLDKDGNAEYHLPPGYAPVLEQQFPAIAAYTRIADEIGGGVVTWKAPTAAGDKVFREDNIKYVDGNFFSVFSWPLLTGTAKGFGPQRLALSETMSLKLFGSTDAVGKTVTVSNQFGNTLYTVHAVYRQPAASDIKAEVLLSFETLASAANRGGNDWADPGTRESGFTSIYLLLQPNAGAGTLSRAITAFVRSINPGSASDAVYLQPLSEMHLAPSFNYPYHTYGNLLLVVVFSAIAGLILLIAWLNYINLSTAQALRLAKETGVRKILGASRGRLIRQQLAETLLLTCVSAGVAIALVQVLQTYFNSFAGVQLSLAVLARGFFLPGVIAIILAGTLLAGGYVAFVLTGFKPIVAIRNKTRLSVGGISVRRALVTFQFVASIVFVIATFVLYRQLQFMRNESLGMSLNQLLVIQGPSVATDEQGNKNDAFKNTLAASPFVKQVAGSNNVPGLGFNFQASGIGRMEATEDEKKTAFSMFICDHNFFNTYGIGFKQGSGFSKADADASWNNVHKVVVNESAARALGFNPQENIIGRKISWGQPFEIIGVVNDYHHLSLREAIPPVIYLASVSYSFFTIEVNTKNIQPNIQTLKKLYNTAFPGNPFEYFFADENYDRQYRQEQQLGKVFVAAAGVAIFIACLGLFGLAAYSARQRTREIGIRKVLGASTGNITMLLSKDYMKLVLVAFIIASPIAWYVMHEWLQNFAYRTTVSWWIFLLAGGAALLITLLTISVQSVKAAVANPVESLRTE